MKHVCRDTQGGTIDTERGETRHDTLAQYVLSPAQASLLKPLGVMREESDAKINKDLRPMASSLSEMSVLLEQEQQKVRT